MRKKALFPRLLVLAFTAAYLSAAMANAATDPAWIAKANNAFALDLYAKLSPAPGNIFFSPSSIETALAMTYAGARGQTAKQMAAVLHLTPGDSIHADLGAFIRRLNGDMRNDKSRGYDLSVANALWGQTGQSFLPDFTSLLKKDYGAGLNEVDYKQDAEGARKTINAWAAKETHDKIQDLIPPGVLNPTTRLTLASAIYFKGAWTGKFDKKDTADEPFHLSGTDSKTIPMMHRTAKYAYAETNDCQALKLDYAGRQLSMIILLPRTNNGLSYLEKALTPAMLSKLSGSLMEKKVDVSLPKFRLTQSLELAKTLAAMGMPDAFGGAADFSGITGAKDFSISDVIHKAYVEVNEEGTEAAAATAVVMTLSVEMPGETPVFRADHPFLFLIQDESSGAILFMGRMAAPESGS
jgi:serpin B